METNMNTTMTPKEAEDKVFRAIDSCLKDFQNHLIDNAQGKPNSVTTFRVDLSSILAKMIVSIAMDVQSGKIKPQDTPQHQTEPEKQFTEDQRDQQVSSIRSVESQVDVAQKAYDNAVKEWEAAKRAFSAVAIKSIDAKRRYELQRVCTIKYQAMKEAKTQLDSANDELSRPH
jgi:hypothetical protein